MTRSFELLRPRQAVEALDADLADVYDLAAYNIEHAGRVRPGTIVNAMEFVAQIPAFTEIDTRQVARNDITRATRRGGHLALRAVELTDAASVLPRLELRHIEPEAVGSSRHGTFQQMGASMIVTAQRTLDALPEYRHRVHDWSFEVTEDPHLARFYRVGFGYMLGTIAEKSQQIMFEDLTDGIRRREIAVEAQT